MDFTASDTIDRRARVRSRATGRPRTNDRVRRDIIVVVAILAAVVVLGAGVDALASVGRVHPGVSVGGIDVGGKTPVEAKALLQAGLAKRAAAPITVVGRGKTWSVTGLDVGASFAFDRLASDAMQVGRTDGPAGIVTQRAKAWTGGVRLSTPAAADASKLGKVVAMISSAVDVAPRDAALKLSARGVELKPSAMGGAADRGRLAKDLLAACASDSSRTVSIAMQPVRPRISDAAAREAQVVANRMISAPATVSYQSRSWTISTDEIASMIKFHSTEASGSSSGAWTLTPAIGAKDVSRVVAPRLGATVGTAPVSARFVAEGSSVSIVPSRDGVGPDVAALARDLTAELADPTGARAVELRTKVTSPSLTTTQARDMGIRERISTFSTAYSGGTAARLNNIRVLAQSLNGELVGPGDTFSLNDAVGERTASKGYQEANAIVRGKLVTQIGGGICQVATTLFNAVFLSGLPIAERVNHSFFISHYPMGRDATVSWGGPDLRWKNTTSKWVLVSATLSGDSIAVSLYGTSPGYDVSYSTVPFTNSVPFKTVKVKDPLQPVGTQTVFQPGENGGKTVVTRVVKKNGAVVRTNTFTSEYTPVDETVAVGSKAVAAKSPVPVGSIKKR